MATQYLDNNGLAYLWGKIKAAFTQLLTNYYTKSEVDDLLSALTVDVSADFTGNITAIIPTKILVGSSLIIDLALEQGEDIVEISIMMGNDDITSSAYDPSTKRIGIANVTGNVSISALAAEIIQFEDSAVKTICVSNWGGNVIEGEITAAEAAEVTSLASKFYAKTGITKFDELRYFTALTSLYDRSSSGQQRGQFYSCTGLTKVTIPSAPISNLGGAFRGCSALTSVDLSPITYTAGTINCMDAFSISGSSITSIKMPSVWSCSSMQRCFPYNSQLVTLDLGTVDMSSCSSFATAFLQCSALTTITGTVSGINQNIDLSPCPLTRESALVILNGLATVGTTRTVKFSSSTTALLSSDDKAIATNKGWTIS